MSVEPSPQSAPIRRELVDSGEMRFELHACGDPNAERLALCLHGFPEHAHAWRHQLPLLADLGYLAWAPNQRGYGATTRPSVRAAYHIDNLLADVAGLIEAAGGRPITLIGHDWGGIVAWLFALRGVRPLDGLVVMNLPHPARFHAHLLHDPAQQRRSRYERFFQLPWLPEKLFTLRGARAIGRIMREMAVHPERFPEADLDVFRRAALEPGAMKAMLDWYRANRFRQTVLADYAPLTTRTLMIWGLSDTALGYEMTFGTERLVDDLTLRYLDASHWVQQDAPEETNAILAAWLTRAPVPVYVAPPDRTAWMSSPAYDGHSGLESPPQSTPLT